MTIKKYFLVLLMIMSGTAQLNAQTENSKDGEIFMNHLKTNWDDIHDVIMRYHYEDPWLKGRVLIEMSWIDGRLASSEILENTSGNAQYANDLVLALQQWEIGGLSDEWSSALPVKTSIKGSEDPDFSEYGILTGRLTNMEGEAIAETGLVLTSSDRTSRKSIAMHTNRGGIFIETLIPPGEYQISCSTNSYAPILIEGIIIEKGKHMKRDIIMEKVH